MAPPYEVRQTGRSLARPDHFRNADVTLQNAVAAFTRTLADEIQRQLDEKPLTGRAREEQQELARIADKNGMPDRGARFFRTDIFLRAGIDNSSGSLTFAKQQALIGADGWTSPLEQLGATVVLGDGSGSYVKTAANSNAVVSVENPGSDVAQSALTLKRKNVTMREIIVAGPTFSRQLQRHNATVSDVVGREAIRATQARITTEALNGSGSGAHPTGLFVDTDVPVLAIGTDGGAVTAALLANMQRTVGEYAAALPNATPAFVTTPGVKSQLAVLPRATGAQTVWTSDADVMGERGLATAAVPSNFTKGTSTTICHGIVFGSWEQLYLHYSPVVEFVVDQYSLKKQGMVEISTYLLFDVAIPTPHAFATVKDIVVPDIS